MVYNLEKRVIEESRDDSGKYSERQRSNSGQPLEGAGIWRQGAKSLFRERRF